MRARILLCLGLALEPVAVHSWAQTAPLEVVTEDYPPFSYLENGMVVGSNTKIVRAVLDHAKVEYNVNLYPWARAYALASSEANVLIFTIYRIPMREKQFRWIRPLGGGAPEILYRYGNAPLAVPKSVEEARNRSVGCASPKSSGCLQLMDWGFENLTTLPSGDIAGLLNMLKENRFDFALANAKSVSTALKATDIPPDQIVPVMKMFSTVPYMALSNATSEATLRLLQASYDDLVKKGQIQVSGDGTANRRLEFSALSD